MNPRISSLSPMLRAISRTATSSATLLLALTISLAMASATMAADRDACQVSDLRCEDLVDPLGIDIARPRLSWRMRAGNQGAAQTAYRVLCATDPSLLKAGTADLWDSGKTTTDQSRYITYDGKPLARGNPYYWSVRIWNETGVASPWSRPAVWTGFDLATDKDWQGKWITARTSSPWLRQTTELKTRPEKAYIYINALGYFHLFINGKRVGADEFTPHVGQYNKRTFCITYDVAKYLRPGRNAVAFWMGSGWNHGGAGVELEPALRAQLETVEADGKTNTLATDGNWRAKASSLAYLGGWQWDDFGGEVQTGGMEQPDWANIDFDDSAWPKARLATVANTPVSAEMLQRSRIIETITAVKVTPLSRVPESADIRVATDEPITIRIRKAAYGIPGEPDQQIDVTESLRKLTENQKFQFKIPADLTREDPAPGRKKQLVLEYELNGRTISRTLGEGESCTLAVAGTPAGNKSWLVDMGKAMTGTFEVTFPHAQKGTKVTMRFGDAYTPNPDGSPGTLNSFNQTSEYIFRGHGAERFKNRFNYASCRYILINDAPGGELTPSDVKGHLITTDLPKASTFSCSDETLNGIYRMMDHTLRCLMLGGYQVDCHSRERQGYGGDGQSSLDTTLCFLRSDAFYRKWTRDWVDGQKPDGGLTYTSPASPHGGGPFWCGFLTAATIKNYQHHGDLAMVRRNYPAIKKWFDLAESKVVDDLQEQFCGAWYLGDWASPDGINDGENARLFIHAYMSYALGQAAQLADALGEGTDAGEFRRRAAARNAATHKKFYNPQAGRYGTGDQVSYVLPLMAGVVPDELHDEVLAGFEKTLMVKNKGHLSTGLSGTYMMIQYLQSIGRDDLIYRFASKTSYPSWGYMIENGATATWEYWNGDGTRIHNCYNSIGSWLIQGLAGIRPDPAKPGFKNALITPAFVRGLTHVNGSHDTAYGTIRSNWKRTAGSIVLMVTIPANTTATVRLPATAATDVTVNGLTADGAQHVTFPGMDGNHALFQVTAGNHEFAFPDR